MSGNFSRQNDLPAFGSLPGDQRPASYMARDGYVRGDAADLWLKAHAQALAASAAATLAAFAHAPLLESAP